MILRIILVCLAVYRLADLLVIDDGPFDIFCNIRSWFNKGIVGNNAIRKTIAEGIQCRYCVGVWFAILLTPFIYFPFMISDIVITIFAVAGVQSILIKSLRGTI